MKVAFICTKNSCRSQMAEAFGRHLAAGAFESYSAGTHPGPRIDPVATKVMRDLYAIDMLADGQHPKALGDIPPVDGVVTMGCGVECPHLPARWRVDWGFDDPAGTDESRYLEVAERIRAKVLSLASVLEKDTVG